MSLKPSNSLHHDLTFLGFARETGLSITYTRSHGQYLILMEKGQLLLVEQSLKTERKSNVFDNTEQLAEYLENGSVS